MNTKHEKLEFMTLKTTTLLNTKRFLKIPYALNNQVQCSKNIHHPFKNSKKEITGPCWSWYLKRKMDDS